MMHSLASRVIPFVALMVSVSAQTQDIDPATFFNPRTTCLSTIPPSAFTRVVVYAYVHLTAYPIRHRLR